MSQDQVPAKLVSGNGSQWFPPLFGCVQGSIVMITIFCDFCQFSAKKLAFFPRTNGMIKYLQKLAVV
jgi:hypothetical protein